MSAYLSMVDKSWTMLVKLAPGISNRGEQPVIIKRVPNICLRPTIYLTLILFNLFQPFSYPLPISLHTYVIITSAMSKVMFSSLSVALSVCLSVCYEKALREHGWTDFHDFSG